jgi:Calcineurin-like phosphoesterase
MIVNNSRIWPRWRRRARPTASTPDGHAIYAVGDIHGRLDLLELLVGRIADDAARHPEDVQRSLIFLGDYIDRGGASREVVERLREAPLPGFETVRLLGNHEQALLDFIDDRTDGREWLGYGGLETLMSYGVSLRGLPRTLRDLSELRQAVAAAVPDAHIAFYRNCVLHHAVGDYVFVHAGLRPGIPLEDQHPADLLWIRGDFLHDKAVLPGKVVVHGHTICDMPQDLGYRINIDTGAFASGRLSCLILRGISRRFLSTLDD